MLMHVALFWTIRKLIAKACIYCLNVFGQINVTNNSLFCDFLTASTSVILKVWIVVGGGATDFFLRYAGWGSGGTSQSPKSRASP